jgi:hypothetical protein
MSNVRALASARSSVIHRRVACVVTVRAGCPSFGGQRQVEAPTGKDSCLAPAMLCRLATTCFGQESSNSGGSEYRTAKGWSATEESNTMQVARLRVQSADGSKPNLNTNTKSKCKNPSVSRPCQPGSARRSALTLPSRGRVPAYGLHTPLMSNVRALARIRIFVIHRRVACVAAARARCPSFGGQRKVEAPASKDSYPAPAALWRLVTTCFGQEAGSPDGSEYRTAKGWSGTEESNTMQVARLHVRSAGRSKPNLKYEYKVQMQEPEYFTAVPARLSSKERSNPSIEGTCSGLRPPHAPHVTR